MQTGDYRFVYLGPKDSWTPMHADVLRSYSWSANISGHKTSPFRSPDDGTSSRVVGSHDRWRLLPPELTFLLYDVTGRQLTPDFALDGIQGIDQQDYANLSLAADLAIEVHQVRDAA